MYRQKFIIFLEALHIKNIEKFIEQDIEEIQNVGKLLYSAIEIAFTKYENKECMCGQCETGKE